MSADREPFDWTEERCPLPVVRKVYDENGDRYVDSRIEVCGEALYLDITETKYLHRGGEVDSCGPTWKVECGNGHVLFVPDHEGDDNFVEMPYDHERTLQVVAFCQGIIASHPTGEPS